ncbi:protocatechuate 3,4-dioxygenase subunit alpha [Maribacter sp. PR1]|uniref:Protocatechuate 3,4-dioxygenase subunit alpha n=1 Tax=Maribacter cobaltidurans TaxID=1178778 RepID=A0ABU7IUK4_9FLAO|nr:MULTISPECIES: protocatechuate 3,4-dioxygenase subunit alpha [Maribacter]MDC6389256.1 protocatechuate 3,4-dioxygenase subunit alpha [Maribacter sp. PR1]MEE1976643.1 protocatechuate 3,4-dioxygenase subunit alpha [Maribacter cobaltidurans]
MSDTLKKQTPSQTIGPYFAYGLTPQQYGYAYDSLADNDMTRGLTNITPITITGTVYEGSGNAIDDAMVELWQDDGEHKLFGRYGTGTDEGNTFTFTTIKPKPVNGEAPYINVILFMRGQLLHSYTRIYFSDEAELNQTDALLQSIDKDRRQTLIAEKNGEGYTFNIHMQGTKETVFFEI